MNLQEVIHRIPESVYIVDSEFAGKLPSEYTVLTLEQITEEDLPAKIENVIYHAGTRYESLEALYKKLQLLYNKLETGGSIMFTPWGASSVPYGERGIECVLMAMGMKIEIPRHTGMKLLQKAVIARK